MTAGRADRQAEQRTGPAASIVVPTYNRPDSLPLAVQSVLDQTFADWELVVVDDASSADVSAVLGPYLDDPRIRVVRRPTNGGAPAARNTGTRHATGRFICFLDDDDIYLKDKLAHQVPALDGASPDIAAVGGRCELTSGKRADPPPVELRRADLLRLAYGNLQLGALLFRRSVVATLGFDESLRVIDDWDLHVRILERHRIVREDVAVAGGTAMRDRGSARMRPSCTTGRPCTTSTSQRSGGTARDTRPGTGRSRSTTSATGARERRGGTWSHLSASRRGT